MANEYVAGEVPIHVTRPHWISVAPLVLLCAASAVAAAVILEVLPGDIRGHSLHQLKVVVALAVTVGIAIALTTRWSQWWCTTFTLTNRRVLVRRGVLSRSTESISLDRVQDTTVRQTLIERVLRCGDVEIESAGRDGKEALHRIADPVGFSNRLHVAVEAHRLGVPVPGVVVEAPAPQVPQGYVPPGGEPVRDDASYGPVPGYGPHKPGGP